jgi:hypothetical protein
VNAEDCVETIFILCLTAKAQSTQSHLIVFNEELLCVLCAFAVSFVLYGWSLPGFTAPARLPTTYGRMLSAPEGVCYSVATPIFPLMLTKDRRRV